MRIRNVLIGIGVAANVAIIVAGVYDLTIGKARRKRDLQRVMEGTRKVAERTLDLVPNVGSAAPAATSAQEKALPTMFQQLWANRENLNFKAIAFDPKWHNGTGYLDRAVKADLGLGDCEIGYSTDERGRAILLIGSAEGNYVFFQRYDDTPLVVVFNTPGPRNDDVAIKLLADAFEGTRMAMTGTD